MRARDLAFQSICITFIETMGEQKGGSEKTPHRDIAEAGGERKNPTMMMMISRGGHLVGHKTL